MGHEILYNQAAEISGRVCQSDFEYVPKKLIPGSACVLRRYASGAEKIKAPELQVLLSMAR
jgi:hypothetical protein